MRSSCVHYLFSSPPPADDSKWPASMNSKLLYRSPAGQFGLKLAWKQSKFLLKFYRSVFLTTLSKNSLRLVGFTVWKSLVYLVGTFVFMSFLSLKPKSSLALPSLSSKLLADSEETDAKHVKKSESEELYERLLENEPRNLFTLKVLLQEHMKRGEVKETVRCVERLINAEPEEVEWRLMEALCYEMMGDLEHAKKLFVELLKTRPLFIRALHGLAMVLHKNDEGSLLFDTLNEALVTAHAGKKVTEERNIRLLKAQMHVLKGQLEEGLTELEALISENAGDFRPYLCQGIIYSLLDRKEEALKSLEIYRCLVPEEFPQRDFLDDIVIAAGNKGLTLHWRDFEAAGNKGKLDSAAK